MAWPNNNAIKVINVVDFAILLLLGLFNALNWFISFSSFLLWVASRGDNYVFSLHKVRGFHRRVEPRMAESLRGASGEKLLAFLPRQRLANSLKRPRT